MSDYHYDRFTADAYDLDNFQGPALGSKAPDATLTTITGEEIDLLDFDGAFLVLELGSITCPLFQSRRTGMADLVAKNPDVDFAVLYVREAHPGAGIGQHKDFANKQNMVAKLQKDDGEIRAILIDDMGGTAHRALGSFPNSLFIINKAGCVVYRSDWNNPRATAKALTRLKSGRAAGGQGLFLPAKPPVAFATLKRAGGDALKDFLFDLPKLIWKNVIKRNLRLLAGKNAGILPDHVC
ncbi:MAG: peroxiredoxin [Paracoccaceae bacterium]|jgi:peroxiredoxin